MKSLRFIPLAVLLASCTYSVAMQHSVGSTDTVEETQEASPTVYPTISVPLAGGQIPRQFREILDNRNSENEPRSFEPRQPTGMNGQDLDYKDWS